MKEGSLNCCLSCLAEYSSNFALWLTDSGFDILNERTSQDSTAIAQSPYAIESNSISVLGQQNDPVLNSADTVNGNMASSSHQVEHRVMETSSSRFAFCMMLEIEK